jgi:hypothetical protein
VNGSNRAVGFEIVLADVGRPALADVPGEPFLDRTDVALVHEHAGDVGPADHCAAGVGVDLIHGDVDAQVVELVDDDRGTFAPGSVQFTDDLVEFSGAPANAEAEDVHRAARLAAVGGDLNARDEPHADRLGGLLGRYVTGGGVMIGQGKAPQTRTGNQGGQFIRRHRAVGRRGMNMQIKSGHAGILAGRACGASRPNAREKARLMDRAW